MPTIMERGEDTYIGEMNIIDVPRLRMESGSEIGSFNVIRGIGKVSLGKDAVISYHCNILTTSRSAYGMMAEHGDPKYADITDADIYIMEDAYIGPYTTICPGVRIGAGAVIGAYSYIMKDVAPDTMIRFKPKKLESERTWYHHRNVERIE